MTPAEAIERVRAADAALSDAGPTPFPLPVTGLEAVIAGAVTALGRADWWVPGLRERVGAVLRDAPVERLVDGAAGARPYKVAPPGASPATRALVAVGLADSSDGCALVHLGIGSASDGALHEALNLAALRDVSVIFLVAVHPLEGEAPLGPQLAASPCALAAAFGIEAVPVDGNSAQAVHDAVAAAREAGGPHLIEARLRPGADIH
jgi:TPP-dependent pyruvate/acetoin dehydrogenase alpha subunit